MTDESVAQQQVPVQKPKWRPSKEFIISAIVAVAVIAGGAYGLIYMWGPGAAERAAELRRNEQVRLLTTLSEHCGAPVAIETGQEFPCVMFLRLENNTVVQVRAIEIGPTGGGMRGSFNPRARELGGSIDLSALAPRSYYERNPDAVAGPRDPERFAALALEYQDQELPMDAHEELTRYGPVSPLEP